MDCVLDFETANPYVKLEEVGSTVYAQHWATEILCLVYDGNIWTPKKNGYELRKLVLNSEVIFVAHNAGFEKDIWREIMVPSYGFPDIPNERWRDTMATAALKGLPLALGKALPVLGLGEKDNAGQKLTISLSKKFDRSPEIMQRVYQYCQNDVVDETALHKRLGVLPDRERAVWLLDQHINERGIRLDRDFLNGCVRIVDRSRTPLIEEFRNLTGVNPTQVDKFKKWLQAQDINFPNLRKETIAEELGDEDESGSGNREEHNLDTFPRNVRRALFIRQLVGSASVRKLSRMVASIAADGRCHRLFQYHGTGPGRWAGRVWNPLNFPRGTVRDAIWGSAPLPESLHATIKMGDPDVVSKLDLVIDGSARRAHPIEVVASSLRHAIVSEPGHRLLVGDFVQIQARIVLAIAGQQDFLDLLRQGMDPYCLTAEDIFNKPRGTWDKKTCPTEIRQVGKNTFLGSGFQMGPSKFCQKYIPECVCRGSMSSICTQQEGPAYQKANKGIQTYRTKTAPMVPRLWREFGEAALKAVTFGHANAYGIEFKKEDGWLTARLYDGKKLYYYNPKLAYKSMPWSTKEEPDFRECWTYQPNHGTRVTAFGGLLTENIVMGHERQLLCYAMQKAEDEGLRPIFNVYDELVCEPETWQAQWPILKEIMEDMGPHDSWMRQIKLPIAAEGWVGSIYKKG